MINVGSTPRKCFCGRAQPNFAHRGQQKPTHCAKCKEPGMVNIRASTCQCGKAVPSFGVPGQHAASYSSSHSLCPLDSRLQSNLPCQLSACSWSYDTILVFWCSLELSTMSKILQLIVLKCRKWPALLIGLGNAFHALAVQLM